MKKLQLNKKAIQTLNKEQMQQIDGGICLASCASGTRKGKACCADSTDLTIDAGWTKDGPYIKVSVD